MDENEVQDNPEEEQTEQDSGFGSYIESVNLAEKLDEQELNNIGDDAKAGYEADEKSRAEWLRAAEQWTELAKLTVKAKSFPWANASNVKYPLLATAAMQFAARAYPSLIPSDDRVVASRIVGKDPDGSKTAVAEVVSMYMSYQLMEEMDGWEEEMDRLLIMLPIVGTMFKKTYWDSLNEKFCSKVIMPQNIVVDYWATSLKEAERISEILEVNERSVTERQNAGLWLEDVELGDPSISEHTKLNDLNAPDTNDDTTPYVFIEQHTFLDLDKDGYKEPYIVTFHLRTGKVMRIVARYDEESITYKDNKLVKIEPNQYYTKFGFVPNPDGSFYDIGFGILLGPINEAVNTLINQLVDAGTINNLQSGFLGKGLRLRMGEQRFAPGEWKVVNSTGDDLKKQIVPLPAKEPSKILFELMQALITSGKELASVAEIFTGKMPGQNTPATTTMASIDQGMKVFTAVYKRIYRSLSEEFKKLYRLNSIYLNPNTYVEILDVNIGPDAFKGDDHRIIPGADPTAVSQTEKLQKAQGLMEMMQGGLPLDPVQVMIRMLEAQEQPNYQQLINKQVLQTGQMPPPPPDPKVMAIQAKAQIDAQKGQSDMAMAAQKAELDKQSAETQLQMKLQEHDMELSHKQQTASLDAQSKVARDGIMLAAAHAQAQQDLQHSESQHQQDLQQSAEQSKAKVAQTRAMAQAKPQPKGAKK